MGFDKLSSVTFEVEVGMLCEDEWLPLRYRDWPDEQPLYEWDFTDPCEALHALERADLSGLSAEGRSFKGVCGTYAALNRMQWVGEARDASFHIDRLVTRMEERRVAKGFGRTIFIRMEQNDTFSCEWECDASLIMEEIREMARKRGGASPRACRRKGWISIARPDGGIVFAAAGKPGDTLSKLPYGDATMLVKAIASAAGSVLRTSSVGSQCRALGLDVGYSQPDGIAKYMVKKGSAVKIGPGAYKLLGSRGAQETAGISAPERTQDLEAIGQKFDSKIDHAAKVSI